MTGQDWLLPCMEAAPGFVFILAGLALVLWVSVVVEMSR